MGQRNSILQKHLLRRWVWAKHERGDGLPFPHVPAISLPDPATPLFQLVKNSCTEAMAGDTHFVCLGGKNQVTDLDRSACVCVCVCVCFWLWHMCISVFLYMAWLCVWCLCGLSGLCMVCVCGVHVSIVWVFDVYVYMTWLYGNLSSMEVCIDIHTCDCMTCVCQVFCVDVWDYFYLTDWLAGYWHIVLYSFKVYHIMVQTYIAKRWP